MKTLRKQIEHRCIHFTGTQYPTCKQNIEYNQVRDNSKSFPERLPCLHINGGIGCEKQQFPTTEEAAEKEAEIKQRISEAFTDLANDVCPLYQGKLSHE